MRIALFFFVALLSTLSLGACSKSTSTCFATAECPEGTEGDICEPADTPAGCGDLQATYECRAGAWTANPITLCDDAGDDADDNGDDAGDDAGE
jgi:hypothetical protein